MTTLIVHTALGDLRGGLEGGDVGVFRGVPYAQPPTGPRRFLPPQPLAPWADVFEATGFAPTAMQPLSQPDAPTLVDRGEDCLALNVWAPTTPGPHPVLVWVHGGGQTSGSTRRPEYDGAGFARQGIVCVTLGYRLGVFGFLELGAALGPAWRGSANNALRDIVAALRWVRSHIGAFGGDPARVTLGGESAGAKNCAALLGVPAAQGLFHQVVSLSGGAHALHAALPTAEAVAALVLEKAGIAPGQAQRLLELPAADLIDAQEAAVAAWSAKFPFRPVVEGRFVTAPVTQAACPCAPVPLLAGSALHEAAGLLGPLDLQRPLHGRELSNLDTEHFAALEQAYAAVLPHAGSDEHRLAALTAAEYGMPTIDLADALAARGAPVWMYRFEQGRDGPLGRRAAHVADLPLWWGHAALIPEGAQPSVQALGAAMHAALVAFVRNGDPDQPGLQWPRYSAALRHTLCLDDTPQVRTDPALAERLIWRAVWP